MAEDRSCQNDLPSNRKDERSIVFPTLQEACEAASKSGRDISVYTQEGRTLVDAMRDNRCLRYVYQYRGGEMVAAVQRLDGKVTDEEFAKTIRTAYRNAECCYRDRLAWGDLFRKAKAIWGVTKNAAEKAAFDELRNPVTIYRACSEGEQDGISWTSCICVAEQMLKDKGEGCVIFRAEISKEEILAYMEGRNESDIIVFPGDARRASVACR